MMRETQFTVLALLLYSYASEDHHCNHAHLGSVLMRAMVLEFDGLPNKQCLNKFAFFRTIFLMFPSVWKWHWACIGIF